MSDNTEKLAGALSKMEDLSARLKACRADVVNATTLQTELTSELQAAKSEFDEIQKAIQQEAHDLVISV